MGSLDILMLFSVAYVTGFTRSTKWRHEKSSNKKVLQKRSPKKLSKIGLRVVQTAHRRRRVRENIALDKVVRLDLVGTGLKLEV